MQNGKLIFVHAPQSENSLKIGAMSENSLKIDLSLSQKTQRSELISSPTGWFAVVSYLISDDNRAVDRLSTLRHPIFRLQVCLSLSVSREIMEIT